MRRGAVLLALLWAGAAQADLAADEATVLPRLLQAIRADLVEETIGEERILLIDSADPQAMAADLIVIAGAPDERAGQPLLVVRGIVYAGTLAGQVPSLEIAPNGSLQIRSGQTAIGRGPWEMVLTLAQRQGDLRVAGYGFEAWDRFEATAVSCDWNLLTGDYVVQRTPADGTPLREEGRQQALILAADWSAQDPVPAFCRP